MVEPSMKGEAFASTDREFNDGPDNSVDPMGTGNVAPLTSERIYRPNQSNNNSN